MSKKTIGIIIVILLLLGGGGVFMFKRGAQPTPTPTPEVFVPQEEVTPEPVEEEEVDISRFKVKVLNGTTVAGLAARMQTALEAAGFTVSGVGNADTKDYQEVVFQVKESVPASVLSTLKDEVKKTYTIGSDETLETDAEDDVVIILGTKSPPTATPSKEKTTTPTPTTSTTITPSTSPSVTLTPSPTKSQ